jgi:hypothetical protein
VGRRVFREHEFASSILATSTKDLAMTTPELKTLECKHHGNGPHVLRIDAKGERWRCKRCEYAGVKRRRKRVKERLVQLLGGACERCSYSRCLRALSFHHRDRLTKEFSLARNANFAWDKLVAEAMKCVLLCSNCHMEIEDELESAGA